jgi:methylenetetrahydrofolate reductase (NADPH)
MSRLGPAGDLAPGSRAGGPAGPERRTGEGHRVADVAELLRRSRFEVIPLDGIEEKVLAHLGTDVNLTVTASPSRGLDATLDLSERLLRAGYSVVPHLSARLVRDRVHLDEVLDRLLAAGVRELFVPAGDADTAAGEFEGAAELLEAMGPRRSEFAAIDITGYPESHHLISDEETIRAMFAKAPMATHIISQICFDAPTILDWIAKVRARGTDLPIWVGVPGVIDRARLMRISMQIGLGESARFLRHHGNWLTRLLIRRFRPDRLLRDLTPAVADPALRVAGFHIYSFNEVERTERWRRETLARLGG